MDKERYTMGIDIGSSTSKCVILKNGRDIAASALTAPGAGSTGPDRAVKTAFDEAGLVREDMACIVATGYGRNAVGIADRTFSELTCHAKGAAWLCPGVRTVIDIGGQDCKALSLSEDGQLQNFIMNDKCAAGTGRFLEVMARILETEPQALGELGEKSEGRVDISSTCTVFAESEVISQLSRGVNVYDLVAGINRSVASRAAGLAKRLTIRGPLFMTGGVSQNRGVLRALEAELGMEIKTEPRAQLAGAIGAALCACGRAAEGGG